MNSGVPDSSSGPSFELAGMIASEGAALGRARVLGSVMASVPHRSLMPQEVGPELHRFSDAVQASRSQMRALLDHEAGYLDHELAEIFEAQLLLLEDPMLIDETREKIRSRKLGAEWALAEETASLKDFLLKARNEMVRERAADLEDMSNRILSNLMGVPEGDIRIPALQNLPPGSILIAHDLSPSLMLHIRENCAGIVTEAGGVTGHMAILARSRGIPVLVHVVGLMDRVADGDALFIEALPDAARLICRPGTVEEQRFASWQKTRSERLRRLREAGAPQSPLTLPDGSEAVVLANLEAVPEAAPDGPAPDESLGRVSGVGLFRTEFLYLKDPALLSDDARHAEIYTRLFRGAFADRPITLRLLDAGDDKAFPPQAAVRDRDLRGVRFLLANPNILETQLRAIFRALQASGYTQLRLLVPVVSRPEEMIGVREAIDRVRVSVAPELSQNVLLAIGMMVETPAAALLSPNFAELSEFFSIGSNDLTRLAIGVDRDNTLPHEELLYQPVVFRLIEGLLRDQADASLISICGEAARRRLLIPVLIGLGLRGFSVAPTAVPECLERLHELTAPAAFVRAGELAQSVLAARSASEVRALVQAFDAS